MLLDGAVERLWLKRYKYMTELSSIWQKSVSKRCRFRGLVEPAHLLIPPRLSTMTKQGGIAKRTRAGVITMRDTFAVPAGEGRPAQRLDAYIRSKGQLQRNGGIRSERSRVVS